MRNLHRRSWIVFALLVACSRHESPTSVAAQRSAPAPSAVPAANVAPSGSAPADSGLAVTRGVLTLAQERMTFKPCGETAELWVVDQTDGALTRVFAADDASSLYVEAHGERTTTDEVPQARASGGVFTLEEALYAAPESEVKGCTEPPPDYSVAAQGAEPAWSVEVRDADVRWRGANDSADIALGAPQMEDAEGGVRYTAKNAERELELSIEATPCRDEVSDEFFAYSAVAIMNGKKFTGCARVAE